MFGSIYSTNPEVLLDSLRQMNGRYAHAFESFSPFTRFFAQIYIFIFGIPEVGFQIRGIHFRKAIRVLDDKFRPNAILDIGCGIGCYSFFLAKKYAHARMVGWDIDKSKLRIANSIKKKMKINNVSFEYGNILKPNKKSGKFDFAIMIDVLEHITDYKKVLRNIYSKIRPGGYIYIHVPQHHQKRFFHALANWEHEDHVREGFEPKELTKVLQTIGFSKVWQSHSFGYFGSFAWEINHLLLAKSQVFAAVVYPLLYGLSLLDGAVKNKRGLCIALLLKKHGK